MVSSVRLRPVLFLAALILAAVDQFAMHGTSFEWVPTSHSTWMDGCASGLMLAALTTYFVKKT